MAIVPGMAQGHPVRFASSGLRLLGDGMGAHLRLRGRHFELKSSSYLSSIDFLAPLELLRKLSSSHSVVER